jgi:hypothetical protein
VPKYRRAKLTLTELGRLARLVQAGLLALHLAGVAREEAGALQRQPQLRVGLDQRPCDPVPDCARLAGRSAASDANTNVVRPLGLGDLEWSQRGRAMGGAREVLLDRAAVEPRRPRAGAKDHARNRRLAFSGAAVLGDLAHAFSSGSGFGA